MLLLWKKNQMPKSRQEFKRETSIWRKGNISFNTVQRQSLDSSKPFKKSFISLSVETLHKIYTIYKMYEILHKKNSKNQNPKVLLFFFYWKEKHESGGWSALSHLRTNFHESRRLVSVYFAAIQKTILDK